MAAANELEKLIVEIMNSLKEYTKEDIDDFEAAKSEIAKMLETYRPIKLEDYEYGLSHTLNKNHRLIVKEENDKTKVREYYKSNCYWYCSNKASRNQKCKSSPLKIKFGIIFAPINHSENCETNELSKVMEIQELLKQGKTKEANGLAQIIKRLSKNQSLSTSILNESNLSTTNMESNSILDQSVTDIRSDSTDLNITSPSELEASTPAEAESESARSSVKRTIDDTEYRMEIVHTAAKMPKTEPINVEFFPFNRPSDDTLTKICEKLSTLSTTKIEYNRLAYKFWAEINFENIPSVSENIQTHSFKSPNIFACFSLFFTGKVNSCFFLHNIINTAFCDDLNNTGEMACAEIDEIFSSNTVADHHLEFICKFLSCRIGIYENGNLKKYGNWESENFDALTLILSVKNGFYSVVLDL